MQVNEGHAPPRFWARAIISERRVRCHQLLILRRIFKASDAIQYKKTIEQGQPITLTLFPQSSILGYFLVEVFFFLAGAFFFFSGGGSSAVAEAV